MANQVGQELLNVPFPEMVKNLALAIAEGQTALDANSVEVTKALAAATVDLPGFPKPLTIPNPAFDPNQPAGPNNPQTIANPDTTPAPAVTFPLIALGISPTFYQFTSAVISLKMAITTTIRADSWCDRRTGHGRGCSEDDSLPTARGRSGSCGADAGQSGRGVGPDAGVRTECGGHADR